MKQKWIKPHLRILVRNEPEESILGTCKYDTPPLGMHGNTGICCTNISCASPCFDLVAT